MLARLGEPNHSGKTKTPSSLLVMYPNNRQLSSRGSGGLLCRQRDWTQDRCFQRRRGVNGFRIPASMSLIRCQIVRCDPGSWALNGIWDDSTESEFSRYATSRNVKLRVCRLWPTFPPSRLFIAIDCRGSSGCARPRRFMNMPCAIPQGSRKGWGFRRPNSKLCENWWNHTSLPSSFNSAGRLPPNARGASFWTDSFDTVDVTRPRSESTAKRFEAVFGYTVT
jgi:hypothetical protein